MIVAASAAIDAMYDDRELGSEGRLEIVHWLAAAFGWIRSARPIRARTRIHAAVGLPCSPRRSRFSRGSTTNCLRKIFGNSERSNCECWIGENREFKARIRVPPQGDDSYQSTINCGSPVNHKIENLDRSIRDEWNGQRHYSMGVASVGRNRHQQEKDRQFHGYGRLCWYLDGKQDAQVPDHEQQAQAAANCCQIRQLD